MSSESDLFQCKCPISQSQVHLFIYTENRQILMLGLLCPGPRALAADRPTLSMFLTFYCSRARTLVHIRLDPVNYYIYSNFSTFHRVRRFSFSSMKTILTCNDLLESHPDVVSNQAYQVFCLSSCGGGDPA
jgi:hypothetical protein